LTRTRTLAAVVLALTFSLPSIAHAAPSAAAIEEGRTRFQKGVSLFRAGDYRAALIEFNAANAVAPSFRIQFNIGQTCAELQEHACATKAFDAFLSDGGKQVPPDQRKIAEKELERLKALVGRVRVIVDASGADVSVDDVPAGTSPIAEPVLVNAGRRKITAKKGNGAPISTSIEVPAGETIDVNLAVAAEADAKPPEVVLGPPNRTPFWIGVGVTAALTITTVTFGVLALGAKSDLDDTVGRFGVSPADVDAARVKVDDLTLATDLFGLATLLAAGATTYLFFDAPRSPVRAGVTPGAFRLRYTF
jgi:hypothetical protein